MSGPAQSHSPFLTGKIEIMCRHSDDNAIHMHRLSEWAKDATLLLHNYSKSSSNLCDC